MLVRHLFIHLFKTLCSKKGPREIVPVHQGDNRLQLVFLCRRFIQIERNHTAALCSDRRALSLALSKHVVAFFIMSLLICSLRHDGWTSCDQTLHIFRADVFICVAPRRDRHLIYFHVSFLSILFPASCLDELIIIIVFIIITFPSQYCMPTIQPWGYEHNTVRLIWSSSHLAVLPPTVVIIINDKIIPALKVTQHTW